MQNLTVLHIFFVRHTCKTVHTARCYYRSRLGQKNDTLIKKARTMTCRLSLIPIIDPDSPAGRDFEAF